MEQMGKHYDRTHRDMGQWKEEMEQKMKQWKEEIKRHFDVVAENIKHDFLHGALPDKIEQHEDRIVRLEQHVSLVA